MAALHLLLVLVAAVAAQRLAVKEDIPDLQRTDLLKPRWDFKAPTNHTFDYQMGIAPAMVFYSVDRTRLVFGVRTEDQVLDWAYDQLSELFRDTSQGSGLMN